MSIVSDALHILFQNKVEVVEIGIVNKRSKDFNACFHCVSKTDPSMSTIRFSMSIESAYLRPTQLVIPLCILPMAMRIETESFVAEMAELMSAVEALQSDVRDLAMQAEELDNTIARVQKRLDGMIAEAQPVWSDDYNLCGDPQCDGWCTVCRDGEYLGEEDYEEKYCRRGKR